MLNKFPLWKNIMLVVVLILAIVYALPNLYGEDASIQVSGTTSKAVITSELVNNIKKTLADNHIKYKSFEKERDDLLIRFLSTDDQFKAIPIVKASVGDQYTVAPNLAPATPGWLQALNANPMKRGLDLQGGIHFLLNVDVQGVVNKRLDGMLKSIGDALRQQDLRYSSLTRLKDNSISIDFHDATTLNKAKSLIQKEEPNLQLTTKEVGDEYQLIAAITPAFLQNIRQYTMDQTLTTLRNRVNELGVSEPIVQQSGLNRIAIDLPGVQDSARASQILGGTATLEFHLVDDKTDVKSVVASGVAPPGTKLYHMEDGQPILLYTQVVLSGDSITSAASSFDESGRPNVNITLGGGGEAYFSRITGENIGNRMAIVYIDTKAVSKKVNDKVVTDYKRTDRVISAPVIQSRLPNRFQITGLTDAREARNLALLLRAGAMPANISIIAERNVGPSLGAENIRLGALSAQVAFIVIVIVMAIYYSIMGIVADIALTVNLILIIAVLSLLGATLTLPGIAGIILTIGMAVDANVLIFERIREELRNGMSIQASIHSGFSRAFSTIVDANVTTLIVGIVLFSIGTGPVRGFAVTLTIGILTSMFTAVTFTRGIVNLIYGGKATRKLSIGIQIPQS